MTFLYHPHADLKASWINKNEISLTTPWIDLTFEIDENRKSSIQKAILKLHTDPLSRDVQDLLEPLKDYFVSYILPRSLLDFENQNLETQTDNLNFIDFSTPITLLRTLNLDYNQNLEKDCPQSWKWDTNHVLQKSRIHGTDLYDPLSFITTLNLMRLENEEKDEKERKGLYAILEEALKTDEELFFRYMGWISRQSYHITSTICHKFDIPIQRSPLLKDHLEKYRADEVGHHKFMEQTLQDLGFRIEDFELGHATKFLEDSFARVGSLSLFAFVCMISIFEPPIYLDKDPLSEFLKASSKPHAAKGYSMHYKINMEHNHAGVSQFLCTYLGPQPLKDCLLAIRLFELGSHLPTVMETNMPFLVIKNTSNSMKKFANI